MRPASARREIHRNPGYDVHIVGVPAARWRDLYQALLRMPWWGAITAIVGAYLAINAVFAAIYLVTGGIDHARAGSFADAFYFSVQTMGTIGYGAMAPSSSVANLLVVAESVTSLLLTALATGLVFARFSRIQPRVVFSSRLAIGPINGTPTLMIRVGNERRSQIVDAVFRLSMSRTTVSDEGVTLYRSADLRLDRDRAWALSRTWMAFHRVEGDSPLAADTPESAASGEIELTLTVSGIDEASGQPMHAMRQWSHRQIVWGCRLADMISEPDATTMVIDMSKFDEVEPTEATAAFPYCARGQ